MTFATLKTEAEQLSAEEKRKLVAHLVATLDEGDVAHRQRMAGKIDDNEKSNWATIEELDRRLGEG